MRVAAAPREAAPSQTEQDELAAALAELEAETSSRSRPGLKRVTAEPRQPPASDARRSRRRTPAVDAPTRFTGEDSSGAARCDRLRRERGSGQRSARSEPRALGPNALPEGEKESRFIRILAQFANPLVLTLLAAAAIAIVIGASPPARTQSFLARFGDAIAILLIVVLNAVLGFYQERRAEAALDALQKLSAPNARVRRGGKIVGRPGRERRPRRHPRARGRRRRPRRRAARSRRSTSRREEAALTGESLPIGKDARAALADDAPLGDRATMLFTGTTVVRGKGARASSSRPARTPSSAASATMIERVGEQKTPLEERLDQLRQAHPLGVPRALARCSSRWGFIRGGRRGTSSCSRR